MVAVRPRHGASGGGGGTSGDFGGGGMDTFAPAQVEYGRRRLFGKLGEAELCTIEDATAGDGTQLADGASAMVAGQRPHETEAHETGRTSELIKVGPRVRRPLRWEPRRCCSCTVKMSWSPIYTRQAHAVTLEGYKARPAQAPSRGAQRASRAVAHGPRPTAHGSGAGGVHI